MSYSTGVPAPLLHVVTAEPVPAAVQAVDPILPASQRPVTVPVFLRQAPCREL